MAKKLQEIIAGRYESVTAFVRDLENRPSWNDASSAHGVGFTGTETYEEADELLLKGDKKTAGEISHKLVAIKQQLSKEAPKRRIYSTIQGCAPNVPAYIAGTPNSMINSMQKTGKTKVLTIAYNVAVSAFVTTDEMRETATQLVGAIMALEAGGTRVNLYICVEGRGWRGKNAGQKWFVAIKIKSAGQALDTLKMCYPLIHPSMFRRHFFRWLETREGVGASLRDGYGCVSSGVDGLKAVKLEVDRLLTFDNCQHKDYKEIAQFIDLGF